MTRQPDVLKVLADARPRQLDPEDLAPRTPRQLLEIVGQPQDAPIRAARRRSRRSRRHTLSLASLATAAVAAGLITTLVIQSTGTPPAGNGGGTVGARDILLAAAEKDQAAGQANGAYWVNTTESGSLRQAGSAAHRYYVFGKVGSELWIAQAAGLDSWRIGQSLGATPASPEDEAAWRAEGSPTQLQITDYPDDGRPRTRTAQTQGGTPFGSRTGGAEVISIGDHALSVAELQALPTSPAALRARLLQYFNGGGGDLPTDRDGWLFAVVGGAILTAPLPAAVRSAAYRLLGDLPSVTSVGAVQDLRGRSGQAVAIRRDHDRDGTMEYRLIVDPTTGQALASEVRVLRPAGESAWIPAGRVCSYALATSTRFTDDNPPQVRAPGPEPSK